MTGKWTKGPWRGCKGGKCRCGYVFGLGGEVYVAQSIGPGNADEMGCPDPHPTEEVREANSNLIEAAPELDDELLQARTDIFLLLGNIEWLESATGDTLEDEDAAIVNAIRGAYAKPSPALSKARGESA